MKVCIEPGCPKLTDSTRCPEHTRARDRERGASTARGYGYEHKRLSKRRRAQAIGTPCALCDKPMLVGQPLALDHTEDRTGYRGVVHLTCNARDGAVRGNAMRNN